MVSGIKPTSIHNAEVFRDELSKRFFPKEKYGYEVEKTPFYVVLSGDKKRFDDMFKPRAGTRAEKELPMRLKSVTATAEMGLTLLHTAAMTGQAEMAKDLIDKGANVNARDARGWTPLHWAAASGDRKTMELLMKVKGVQFNCLNHRNGTFKDVLSLTQLRDPGKQKLVYIDEKGQAISCNGWRFQELFGVKAWLDEDSYVSPEVLMEDWISPASSNDPDIVTKEEYAALRKNPTRTAAYRIPELGEGVHGWKSLQEFKPGELIDEYRAEQEPKVRKQLPAVDIDRDGKPPKAKINYEPELDYRFFGLDALKYRSLTALGNDSFPNAAYGSSHNLAGAAKRAFVYATRPIKPGDPIHISYGNSAHTVRWALPRRELSPNEMIAFWKDGKGSHDKKCQAAVTRIDSPFNDAKEMRSSLSTSRFNMYHYLFSTPNSLAVCAAKSSFTFKDVIELFEVFKILEQNRHLEMYAAEMMLDFIKGLATILDPKKNVPAELAVLLEKANSVSGIELVLFLKGIKNPSPKDIEQYLLEIDAKVQELIKRQAAQESK